MFYIWLLLEIGSKLLRKETCRYTEKIPKKIFPEKVGMQDDWRIKRKENKKEKKIINDS